MAATSNPYLEGSFAPVAEEVTAFDLPVDGTIPEHLDGRYLRNGPNPRGDVDPTAYHWFTGTGMVHGVRLRDGKAEWYRNRWVQATDGDFPPNTNVIGHAGRTFAIVEGGFLPYELGDELDTVGKADLDGTLRGAYTAHPKRDPHTGELHAVSYFWGWGNRVRYTVIDRDARVRKAVDIEVGGSPMMHDFSLTEHYVVLYDLPVTFDVDWAASNAPKAFRRPTKAVFDRVIGKHRMPDRLTQALMRSGGGGGGGGHLPYRWDPEYPARVGVMPREGTSADVQWFDVEPCYVFHPMNAYEEPNGNLVLDVVRHPSMFRTDLHGPNEGPPTLDRWTVDRAAGKVLEERIDDEGQEFPRVDERLVGLPHRYGYAVGFDIAHGGGQLIKHDLAAGSAQRRAFGAGSSAGEFVFVPASDGAAEDDGILMGLVSQAEQAELMVLDAGTLETVAAVHLPQRVPNGFHGNWVPTGQ